MDEIVVLINNLEEKYGRWVAGANPKEQLSLMLKKYCRQEAGLYCPIDINDDYNADLHRAFILLEDDFTSEDGFDFREVI